MNTDLFRELHEQLLERGFADEIEWARTVEPPTRAVDFALEAAFVICNSGMKATLAVPIYKKVRQALTMGKAAGTAFGHRGKARAIDRIWSNRDKLFDQYMGLEADSDRVQFLADLPFIGPITKFHLARNFGVDCIKPDRHLVRIAEKYHATPQWLCQSLAERTHERLGTVDCILWRAAEQGLI